jgi:hypothetical protein
VSVCVAELWVMLLQQLFKMSKTKHNDTDKAGANTSQRTQLSAHTAHSGEKWCLLHCLFLQCGCAHALQSGARNGLRQIRHAPRSSTTTTIASNDKLMTPNK